MAIRWSMNAEDGCPVFVIMGLPTAGDADQLMSAADWVSRRSSTPVVFDLRCVSGFKTGGEEALADCVERLSPPGVVLLAGPDLLASFEEPRLLALPRIHRISEAPEALVNLVRRNALRG